MVVWAGTYDGYGVRVVEYDPDTYVVEELDTGLLPGWVGSDNLDIIEYALHSALVVARKVAR